MLEVVPLRSLRYDPAKAGDMAALIAPPYDVIGPADRAALEARSRYNAVHLILPRGEEDRYERAAKLLGAWRAAGVLRGDAPAMWLYEQSFSDRGRPTVRRAVVAGVRVRPFEDRVVLPHERTHAAAKEDRYRLKMAAGAHLSPFFALYDDADGIVARALGSAGAAEFDVVTPDGIGHRMRRLPDDAAGAIAAALGPRHLVIADGHHRYETMLRIAHETGAPEAAIGFGCLVRLQDEGLVVWPTHRLLRSAWFDATAFVDAARSLFAVEARPVAPANQIEAIVGQKRACGPALAVVAARRDRVDYLQLRDDAALDGLPEPLRPIEAALLERALRAFGPADAVVSYTHDATEAIARVRAGEADAAFVLPAARVHDVVAVAEAGLSMPQKSTFFYPKIPSGLLFHPFA